jgi:glycosyltransferase involved in cell wall biosynthesis
MTRRKVLIIVENLPVPFDTRVWKEALSLGENGYEVTVLCPKDKKHSKGYEQLNGVHIYRHAMPPEGSGALSYIVEFACALISEMIFAWWIYFRRGFHVIQGCNPPDDIFLVVLPFQLLGVKYIFDHHDVNPELYLSKFERRDLLYRVQVWLERLTFASSDVVMSTNESYRRIATGRGRRKPEDVFVVRNGPDPEKFRPVLPIPELKHGKDFLVGYVGTMSVQEGLDILIDVAQLIRKRGRKDVHFTCVGGGPGLATLRQMVKDRQLEEAVDFTGRVPDKDLIEILSTADVCVNPDRPCEMNDISTMIKIAEYMALGKPIVQFDLKEGRFTADQASLYCNHSIEDFADKILWLLDHPEERKQMGDFGRQRVEECLSWEYSKGNLLAAYERAFEKRSKGRERVATSTEISS